MNDQANLRTYTFHVNGMHCNSCVILTESELKDVPGITKVKANLGKLQIEVTGAFGEKSVEAIASDLSAVLKPHGYTLSVERQAVAVTWSDFKLALPIALGFVALFIVLQKLGIMNLIGGGEVHYGTAFVIGLVASVSTCMAVVGGLVLSVSANFAKEGDAKKPQTLFHVGRLVSFFILGGLIGLLGASFQLGSVGTFILSLLVGLVMLVLGINLLDIFPWFKKLQPTMPKFLSRHVLELKKVNHSVTPVLLGVATFFLPCGFTQSMQIYALSTGGFMNGALIMFAFALGTLPALALLSFASLGIKDKTKAGIFFKSAGLVVIFFALFNILNSLVAIGALPPLFNF